MSEVAILIVEEIILKQGAPGTIIIARGMLFQSRLVVQIIRPREMTQGTTTASLREANTLLRC